MALKATKSNYQRRGAPLTYVLTGYNHEFSKKSVWLFDDRTNVDPYNIGHNSLGVTVLAHRAEREKELALAAAHMQKIIQATNSFIGGNFDILSDLSSVDQVQAATASTNPSKNPIFQRAVPRITGFQHHNEDSYRQRYIAWRDAGSSSASLPDPTDTSTYDDTSEYNTCPDHLCTTITVQDLKNWGYLDQSESLTNNLGQGYRIVVRKIVLSPQQNNIDVLLFTDTPVVNNSNSSLGAQNDVGDAWRMAKNIQGNYMGVTSVAHPSDVAGTPASTAVDNVFADGEIVAFGQNAKKGELGWFAKGKKWGTNNAGGDGWWTEALLVARVGYWSDNPNGVYLRRDGSLPATGPLNMGGNFIVGLAKVDYDSECNNPAGTTKEVKAQVGAFADANITGNGTGIKLTCVQDGATGKWRKATGGIDTVADFEAGLMNGYETNAQKVCLTDSIGNEVITGLFAALSNNQTWIKFVTTSAGFTVYGSTTANTGTWHSIVNLPYNQVVGKNAPLAFNPYHVFSEVNNAAFCTSSQQDPLQIVILPDGRRVQAGIQALDTTTINFSGKDITLHSRGTFSRTVANTSLNRNTVDFAGANPTITCPQCKCVTTIDALGNSSSACSDVTVPVTTTGAITTTDSFITSQVGQDAKWTLSSPSPCVNPDKSAIAIC